jgi:Tfp pilus assembly PilM family ATPase
MINPSNLSKSRNTGRPFLCVDFGESFIKVVYLQNRQGAYTLLGHGLVEFGATQKNEQDVSRFLKQLLEHNSFKAKEVAFSVSDPEGVFIKTLDLAKIPAGEEPLYVVKEQLKKELAINLDEHAWDFQVIREYTQPQGGKRIKLICVFVKKSIINKYVQAVKACGLLPKRISTSAFNYGGTLAAIAGHLPVSAVLDIAGTHSYLAIYQDNKLTFVRDLEFSTEKLRAALVGMIATKNGRIEVNVQQAKELLIRHGIPADLQMDLEFGIKGEDLFLLIRPLLEKLTAELCKAIEDFKHTGAEAVGWFYLTGGGANLKNLDVYLAQQLKTRVSELPIPKSLIWSKIDAPEFSLEANQLGGVLGLSLITDGINLLPFEIKTPKSKLIALIKVLVLIWLLIFLASIILIRMQKPLADTITFSVPLASSQAVSSADNLEVSDNQPQGFKKNRSVSSQQEILSEAMPPEASYEIILTGIFWEEKNPLAIINGKVVGLGQPVADKKVVGIKRDRVILSDGQSTVEIKLKERLSW